MVVNSGRGGGGGCSSDGGSSSSVRQRERGLIQRR